MVRIALAVLLVSPIAAQQFFDARTQDSLPRGRVDSFSLVADIDGDTDLDLMVGSQVFLNDGRGRFSVASSAFGLQSSTGSGVEPGSVLADFDGDGDLDLFRRSSTNESWMNDGLGRFTIVPNSSVPMPGASYSQPSVVDFDGDGDLDLFYSGQISPYLMRNEGGLLFRDVYLASVPSTADPIFHVAADFDGDGDVDLMSKPEARSQLELLVNDGSGGFTDVTMSAMPIGVTATQCLASDADGDGDGDTDVFTAGRILINDGAGRLRDETDSRFLKHLGNVERVAFGDLDGDGDVDMPASD